MRYPEYIGLYRPKGTIIKKVNDTYYAYYATSKRVPDKNYPVQIIKGLAGKVDEHGFHPLTKAFMDTEKEYTSRRKETVKERRNFYRSMIVYLSNNSYLNDDAATHIYSAMEMVTKFHVGIPNQITAIGKICEYDLGELEPLKYICSVRMGERVLCGPGKGEPEEAV